MSRGIWVFIPYKEESSGGCAVVVLIFACFLFLIGYLFRPTYSFERKDVPMGDSWKVYYNIEYQKWIFSDSIFGNLWYLKEKYVENGHSESYEIKTVFKGVLKESTGSIILKDDKIKYSEDYSYEGHFDNPIQFTIKDDSLIYFKSEEGRGGKTWLSSPFLDSKNNWNN
jgi:hypothetical protein